MAKKVKETTETTLWTEIKALWKDLWTTVKSDIKTVWDDFKEGIIAFVYCIRDFIIGALDILVTFLGTFIKSAWKLTVEALIKWIQKW